MTESPLFWPVTLKNGIMFVLDETLLPARCHYIKVTNVDKAVHVIRTMKTRAFGQFLVVLNTFLLELAKSKSISEKQLMQRIQKTAAVLNESRPTFPFSEVTGIVLHWATEATVNGSDIRKVLRNNIHGYLSAIREKRLNRVKRIASVIKNGDTILTHCNVSGELAMAAVICRKEKKKIRFFATETRPYFQGAKLTCWELKRAKADVTLVADNAVGSLMMDGLIDRVIIGSDRSCANGDIANKIGSYQIAVLAKEFKIPLYVLTQPSNKIKRGKDIPVEIRKPEELLVFEGKRVSPNRVKGFYPGFDVVPHQLITKAIAIDVK